MRISDWSSDVCSSDLYPDGTTDVTRTIAIGEPSAEMRRRFTLVLKGHIALARARFPKDTTGSQLDAVARYALWQEGLRSEERRVGTECVSTCRYRGSPSH